MKSTTTDSIIPDTTGLQKKTEDIVHISRDDDPSPRKANMSQKCSIDRYFDGERLQTLTLLTPSRRAYGPQVCVGSHRFGSILVLQLIFPRDLSLETRKSLVEDSEVYARCVVSLIDSPCSARCFRVSDFCQSFVKGIFAPNFIQTALVV